MPGHSAGVAPRGGVRVGLTTSSKTLSVPSTAFVPEGETSVQFRADANVSEQDEDVMLTANSDGQSGTASVAVRTIKPALLSCERNHVQAGGSVMCSLQLSSAALSDSLTFGLSSNSTGLKIPTEISTRIGQRRIRFEATADPNITQSSVVLEARLASTKIRETLAILSPGVLSLAVPDHLTSWPGSPMHFTVAARDGQNLPLTVSASDLPAQAVFDAQTGDFAWLPAEKDLGRHMITFTTTNAVGTTISKTTTLDVDLGHPRVTSLQNGAGVSASPGCSPGSVATLLGSFLSGSNLEALEPSAESGDGGFARVLVNGTEVRIIAVADERVDFVCPLLEPGTSLEIAVKTKAGLSNRLRTTMQVSAPGIFTIDGSGSGQALAWRADSGDLAVIPNFRFQGKPSLPGDKLSILVTGIDCVENFGAVKPLINLGNTAVAIDSVTGSTRTVGACEVGITIPDGVEGDAVPLTLGVIRSDGRVVTSNAPSIAIDYKR